MVEISDSLHSLFSAEVEEREGRYVVEVPRTEVERDGITPGETYRVGMFVRAKSSSAASEERAVETESRPQRARSERADRGPPVDEGEVREVTIESVGDQGDGIAKVDRGYVLIVPDAAPGDEVTVEIEQVRENVAFTRVVDGDGDGHAGP